jgi:uncharacterized damage-inducible protein DinB
MARKKTPASPTEALLKTYAINDAMNQLLLSRLDPRAWRAEPPGQTGNGRTLAAIFTHLHNNRLVWLKNSAPHLKCPAPLDPDRCTLKQAAAAHKKSGRQCLRMLTEALSADPIPPKQNRLGWGTQTGRGAPRVTIFSRGSWAPTWPADATMFAYMFAHEGHHRGQIIMLAHQLGYRLPDEAAYGIWQWDKLWKQAGLL